MKHHHHREGAVLDWLGLGLSGLCAVHCLVLPLLIGLIPFARLGISDQFFHIILAILILPLGLFAFWRGFRRHRRRDILILGSLGLALVVSGLFIQPAHHNHEAMLFTTTWSLPLTVLGSFALISAHYQNWRQSRCRSCGSVES